VALGLTARQRNGCGGLEIVPFIYIGNRVLLDSCGGVIHVHPATQRFIEVLTVDVEKWEGAAKRVDELLPHLHPSEVEGWKETAARYRENAAEYKALIEQAKEREGA
jgi:hypothetical protein